MDDPSGVHRWRLVRHCALSPPQLMWSYGVVIGISAAIGVFFGVQGYWVIPVWCLFQVVLAGVMYVFYLIHAVDGEQITLSPDGRLTIDVTRGLQTRQHVLPLAWSRVERGGRGRDHVWVCCSQQRIEVGTRLRPRDRRRIERELKQYLREASLQPSWAGGPR